MEKKVLKKGDVVKFGNIKLYDTEHNLANLAGALGLVLGKYEPKDSRAYYLVAIDKQSRCVTVFEEYLNDLDVLSEEQLSYVDLTKYFSKHDIEACRGEYGKEPSKPDNKDVYSYPKNYTFDPTLLAMRDREILKNWKTLPYPIKQEALCYQVGGSHYKDKAIQPVEYITANKLDFLEGCIVKRITRHREKLGAVDICKARQECDLILQLEYGTTFEEVMKQQKKNLEQVMERTVNAAEGLK